MSLNSKTGFGQFSEVACDDPTFGGCRSLSLSSRLPSFIGLDGAAVEILRNVRLLFVGLGSVGGRIADHASRFHPRKAWMIDPSSFKPESVLTHAVTPAEVGAPKAQSTARRFKVISPHTQVFAFDGPFQDIDQLALRDADVVILATDNLAAEVAVSEACTQFGKPLIQGSVYGDGLVAQVRAITNRDPAGPCLACGYRDQDWEHFYRQTHFSCAGSAADAPTMSTSFLCSTAADLVSTELLRRALSLGEPLDDSHLEYCGYTQTLTRSPLARNDACPCRHVRWKPATPPRPVRACSLTELADAAGLPVSKGGSVKFRIAGHRFVEMAYCCEKQLVGRFVPTGQPVGKCAHCHKPLPAARVFSLDRVAASRLGALADEPLTRLGAAAARWVVVEQEGQAIVLN